MRDPHDARHWHTAAAACASCGRPASVSTGIGAEAWCPACLRRIDANAGAKRRILLDAALFAV